jgi:hypothetical protein
MVYFTTIWYTLLSLGNFSLFLACLYWDQSGNPAVQRWFGLEFNLVTVKVFASTEIGEKNMEKIVPLQGCQIAYFHAKNPDLGIFRRAL